MIDHTTATTRALLAELAGLDRTIRDAPTVVDPDDAGSALSPQFLHLLNQQLVLIGELRRRRAAWRAALAAPPDSDTTLTA